MQNIRRLALCAFATLLTTSAAHSQARVFLRTMEILGESPAARYAAEKVLGNIAARMTAERVGASVLDNPKITEEFLSQFPSTSAIKLNDAINDVKTAHSISLRSPTYVDPITPRLIEKRSIDIKISNFTFDPPLVNYDTRLGRIKITEVPNPTIPVAGAIACTQFDCDKAISIRLNALLHSPSGEAPKIKP